MDAGLTGGMIGLGVIVCIALSSVCYEKGKSWKDAIKRRWSSYRHLHAPLLPVSTANPVLVRSGSKQWKMKELVSIK